MYSSRYLFLLMAAYFLFLRRSHYDYEAELIFSPEEHFDSDASSNRGSRITGAIAKFVATRFPYIYGRGIHRRWCCKRHRFGLMGHHRLPAAPPP